MNNLSFSNRSPEGSTKQTKMRAFKFELDPYDLLWRDLFNSNNFAAITQKVTHPVDIYETETGILFEVAAVGLESKDIDISIDGDLLRIKYDKPSEKVDNLIYSGIKKSSFDLSWKISTKFDLNSLNANLDKGILSINIPVAEGKTVRKIEIVSSIPQLKLENSKK
jgi:HSP20 family protein